MVTGFGSMEKAIEATKAGAFYYVEKPVEFEELLVLIEKAVERKQQARKSKSLRGKLSCAHFLRRRYRRQPCDAGYLRDD